MASKQITLFDLRSKEPNRTWSLNPWKSEHALIVTENGTPLLIVLRIARLVLNFKGLDYKTEWVKYTPAPHTSYCNEQLTEAA